jgi:hypothetical protein
MENNFKTKGNPLPENFKNWFDFYESLPEHLKKQDVIIVSDIFDSTYILSKNSLFPNKDKHSEFLLVDIKENVLNELIEERKNKKQSFVDFHIEVIKNVNERFGSVFSELGEKMIREKAESYYDYKFKKRK